MGIDFRYHGRILESAPSWSYSWFNGFRTELAAIALGIDLRAMVGFGGDKPWDPHTAHPLYPLLNHSDCDGELSPAECRKVAPALAEYAGKLADEYDQRMAGRLASAMEVCAAHHAPLEFC